MVTSICFWRRPCLNSNEDTEVAVFNLRNFPYSLELFRTVLPIRWFNVFYNVITFYSKLNQTHLSLMARDIHALLTCQTGSARN